MSLQNRSGARWLPLSLMLLTGSCQTPDQGPSELDRVEARYIASLNAYEREKARLEGQLDLPMTLDFDGAGLVIVHRLELLGGPDRAYLRARFTYVNSTGQSVPIPTLHLNLLDPAGEVVKSAALELRRPLGTTYPHDNAYTGWMDAEVGVLYRQRGWFWALELEAPQPERVVPALSSRR